MAQPPLSYPGVYIQEVPSGARAITGVSTSIAAFIGMTPRGEMLEPKRVLSFAEYQREFGDDTAYGEMADQVRQFFLNGGREAFCMRVANGAEEAEITLRDEGGTTPVLIVRARDAGTAGGQIRIEIDYATPSPESTFNLTAYREITTAAGRATFEGRETHSSLSMRRGDRRFCEDVVNKDSRLVRIEVPEALEGEEPGNGFSATGLVFATGDEAVDAVRTAIHGLLAQGDTIGISVDGQRSIDVTLPNIRMPSVDEEGAAVQGEPLEEWCQRATTAINDAVAADTPVTVSLPPIIGGYSLLQIGRVGGAVVITPAATRDATKGLQLGVLRGGIEIAAWGLRRPAPTGLFSRLRADLAALLSFATSRQSDLRNWMITDGSNRAYSGLAQEAGAFAGPDAESLMCEGTRYTVPAAMQGGVVGSLENVRQNLEILCRSIDAKTGKAWNAELQGHRMVLTATFGTARSDSTAALDTFGEEPNVGLRLGTGGHLFDRETAPSPANARAHVLGTETPRYTEDGDAVGGSDGGTPEAEDYDSAFLTLDRKVDLFNLLVLPRAVDDDEDRENVWAAAGALCLKRRAFLLVDPRRHWSTVSEVEGGIADVRLMLGPAKDHSAIYWPRLTLRNGDGVERQIDPGGSVAGLMARTDATRGVWKAAAGIEASIAGLRGVQYGMTDDENGVINKAAVNAIRRFPDGVIWGARTVDGYDNSGNTDYRYSAVRRFALFIEESLYRGLKWVVFEPNAEPLWAQIRLNVGAFMHGLFRQSAFKGDTPQKAYFVKCDSETTTQTDINLGIVNIWVGFSALKPAEFVVLYLQQMAGQSEATG